MCVRILAFFLASLCFCAHAEGVPPPPSLAVKAYLLKDFNSNTTLATYKENERIEPASLTKLMTAYLVFDALQQGKLKLNQSMRVTERAWKIEGSRMWLNPDRAVTVDELLHGLIIQSGNDAAITLALGVAGSEEKFVDLMNQQAEKFGMKDTHFANVTGLTDKNHYSTANDLATLASALISDFPLEYRRLYSMKEYTYNKINQTNRNRLLWLDPNVDGMKTGHTDAAGYCLIASAMRGNTRLISVVLGAVTDTMRASESQRLLNYGFQFYESILVYQQKHPITSLRVYKGKDQYAAAGLAKDYYLTLPRGDYARVKATITTRQPIVAPVTEGQQVGKITFTLDGKPLGEQPLVSIVKVDQGNFFSRFVDSMRLFLE
jgi:serine-type D-Ala-D-Ala carboxypeptidase (penicillin-binding protein 5/6)